MHFDAYTAFRSEESCVWRVLYDQGKPESLKYPQRDIRLFYLIFIVYYSDLHTFLLYVHLV